MEAHSLPEALNLIMEQRDCSQAQLGRDLGKGQTWVSEMIRSKRGHEFARVINILARVGWEVVIRPKREKSDPVKRREFVAAAASVMFVPSPQTGPYQDPTYLQELTRRVAADRYQNGSASGVFPAMRHIRQITSAVESRDKKLQMAASGLAVELVWTLNDAGRFDTGQKVGELALTLARLSQDADAQSRALSVLARVQYSRRDGGLAVKYAHQGVKLHELPAQQQAWLKLRHGWSLSMVNGQEGAARDVLDNVRGFLADVRSVDDAEESRDTAELMGDVGRVLYDLGDYREAQGCLAEAIQLLGGSSAHVHGLFLSRQVAASLRAGQPEYAADRMLTLARVVPLVNSAQLNTNVRDVLAASRPWHAVPEIRTARAQLRAVWPETSAPA
jgi:predicted XRE-type DNA-binding protein/tetratricopeptide (TPR) repeat protein